ncbi:Thiol-disulfide oxidoreductase YkuV [termite gut metagenome]|uniref:Thiol-disulfide oxidoreductase YkuV n=1 Tax=termite gut metagenome TaxID=433724 RepID=A0A5J4RN21_9ZZZZ
MKAEKPISIYKKYLFFLSVILLLSGNILLSSCHQKQKRPDPNFYENLYTGEIMAKQDFENFYANLISTYSDSIEKFGIHFHFSQLKYSANSIIQPFKYDIKIGTTYLIRANNENIDKKIGTEFPIKTFLTLNGDSITLGGIQDKPTLINLWFIECPGCIAEIPALNQLHEKYADKMNFVSMTFENKKQVEKFLKKKQFNFVHIVDGGDFITSSLETNAYPQNIFIDKQGLIKFIEGGIAINEKGDGEIGDFENIIGEVLLP